MNLLKMSFSGGILILVIIIIRAIAKNRLPKRAFLILWAIAFLRLLLPFSVPAVFSAYSLIGQNSLASEYLAKAENAMEISGVLAGDLKSDKSHTGAYEDDLYGDALSLSETSSNSGRTLYPEMSSYATASSYPGDYGTAGNANNVSPWLIIYLTGLLSCIAFLAVSYWKCLQKFRMSLPVDESYGIAWLKEHPLKRNVSIRQSDMITAPLTYGLLHPVILMPKTMEWENKEQIKYILMHEYVHIRRFDSAAKLIAAITLCVHWFNPMVWIMYALFNRDLELSCDERVVRAFGENSKALYANTLIYMEEKRSGLVPFYSSFSKNAIEERITAIMKIKKTSFAAIMSAVVLIAGVAALFATSAKSAPYEEALKEALTQIPGEEFTKEESEKLFSLWIDDYEEMSVADYREIMNKMADEPEMIELIDRFSSSELAYEIKDDEEAKALKAFTDYFFYIFEPLTAEKWETREYAGYAGDQIQITGAPVDSAVFEYEFSLNIINAERLKVGEYDAIREEADNALFNILNDYTMEELCDEQQMRVSLDEQISLLTERLSTEDLKVEVTEYYFRPVSSEMLEDLALHDETNKESEALWEETLSPYIPFGLNWTYIPDYDGGDVKMTWQGREVRGIFDEKRTVWITAHAGISTYSADAVELYAIYENGELTGLRLADEEEMAAFNEDREASTSRWLKEKSKEQESEEWKEGRDAVEAEREASGYPPGTEADYRSLFALMTPGYENMSVAEFNAVLLEWANENFDSDERIRQDVGLNDYHVNLSQEEKKFVALTVMLSGEENVRMIQSLNTGRPEEACHYVNCYMDKSAEGVWCSLWYRLEYRISDKEGLKVKERDQCITGIQKEVDALWAETDLEQLLSMSEEDVAEQLNAIAASHSNDLMTVSITENDIQFEKMDERRYLN